MQPEKAAPDAALRSQQEGQKKARDAAALFTIETADLAALRRMDPSVECYNDMCVTKRTNFLSYRGMNVCTSDVSLTAAAGRITTVGCDVAITTARDINAALIELLGTPKKSQTDMSANLSWAAEKRSIQIVYWKGTNVHGTAFEKWSVNLGER